MHEKTTRLLSLARRNRLDVFWTNSRKTKPEAIAMICYVFSWCKFIPRPVQEQTCCSLSITEWEDGKLCKAGSSETLNGWVVWPMIFNLASVGVCQIIKKFIENHNADSYTTCIMVFRCEYSSECERKELNHTKGDFNPPQTSDEPVFKRI